MQVIKASQLERIMIEPEKKGKWRVKEEFVNAIRGIEEITHTDFTTGAKYMEWTDAVTISMQTRNWCLYRYQWYALNMLIL